MSADDITLVADDTTSQGASSTLTRSVESPDGLESDGKDVLFATRNVGDCVEFEEHIRRFIQDFLPTVARGNECGAGNLIGFVQNIDVQVDKSLCDKWLEVTKKPNQNIFFVDHDGVPDESCHNSSSLDIVRLQVLHVSKGQYHRHLLH
jgi:hypothetical protein